MEPPSTKPFTELTLDINYQKYCSTVDSKLGIATLVGSSEYNAISDDALKDEDNAGWILKLEPSVSKEWIERIRWIRLVDRLAECELIGSKKLEFQTFLAEWQQLLQTGHVEINATYQLVLHSMRNSWFSETGQPLDQPSISAWNQYVLAIEKYHSTHLIVETFEQYEQLLTELAGSFFQMLPFLADKHRPIVRHFGIVDQFYNHLRDLQEDAEQGICYLPLALLDQFGISRQEILQKTAPQNPNYCKMMQFWLGGYLPRLRRKARQLITADDLHPSWQILCDWSVYRYRRIEQVFRECQFDYTLFPERYWQRVRDELPFMLTQIQNSHQRQPFQGSMAAIYTYLRGWQTLNIVSPIQPRSQQFLSAV
ncbi:MAG: squalene/phytoene synthase family protein [Oscillatoriales cyanobacterium C42_A2020_001]|nr:squalene/phytoene synthase family protein [Leptolyngbyaceae cyanobacterium C42_A2020_001]